MKLNGRLELTWTGKENRRLIEKRILIEDKSKSYGAPESENMLIHGDNLLALKALEKKYTGKIKCIYIDPPYNTGSAFEYYDDNLEHSIWLSLMRDRLEMLHKLLKDDGTIWISIDADESHYLKVLCDEVFGRSNFIDEIVWQRAYAPINLKKTLSRSHDTLLVYAKNLNESFRLNTLPRSGEALARYKNPDNDPRGIWQSDNLWVGPRVEANVFEIVTPSGRSIFPPDGYSCRLSRERFDEYVKDNRIWFGPNGDNTPRIKRFLSEVKSGVVAMTWWPREEIGDNQEAKREIKALGFSNSPFDTPKPERLIERVLTLATNEGDLVLDSFLGSGTTCAVAHKMKRRYIGIEMEDTAYVYCKPRLDAIIDGKELGGITKSSNWVSGGGYHFYELSEPIFVKHPVLGFYQINPSFDLSMFRYAICSIEGYEYKENSMIHGFSSEKHYIHITRDFVNGEYVKELINSISDDESLTIYCMKYQSDLRMPENIEIIDIMKKVLPKCVDLKEEE